MSIDFASASSEYVNCGSGASIDDVLSVTLSGWFKFTSLPGTGQSQIFAHKLDTSWNGWYWGLSYLDSAVKGRFYQKWSTTSGDWKTTNALSLSTGVWCHILTTYAGTATGNDPTFYLNGASQAITETTGPAGSRVSDAANSMDIGGIGNVINAVYMNGQVEDFRVFNRILSAAEISILAAGHRGPLSGEVGWWSMETAYAVATWSEASLANNVNYLPDRSGNGNTGNPVNTPTGKASACPRYRPRPYHRPVRFFLQDPYMMRYYRRTRLPGLVSVLET